MSPAGVQGASAFKVAALGSHSSPPPVKSKSRVLFSVRLLYIRIPSQNFVSRNFFPPPLPFLAHSCLLAKRLYFPVLDMRLASLATTLEYFSFGIFLGFLGYIYIYIYIRTFIERLDRKYWIEFATSKIRRDYVRKVETRWIIFSSQGEEIFVYESLFVTRSRIELEWRISVIYKYSNNELIKWNGTYLSVIVNVK